MKNAKRMEFEINPEKRNHETYKNPILNRI